MSQVNRRLNMTMIGVAPPYHLLDEQPFELSRQARSRPRTILPPPLHIPPTVSRKQLPTMHITDFPRRSPSASAQLLAGWAVCLVVLLLLWVAR
jgi:hypothetical protein